MPADNTDILMGVCGGVAAYKTAMIVSQLVQKGLSVQVAMSQNAHEFIGPATFMALTGRPPVSGMFDPRYPLGPHIELARASSLFCIAPATANFLGKAANGIADDLLSTLYLSFTGPVLLAPAMNCEMWDSSSVQRNVNRLRDDGVEMIGPESGWLSCRVTGMGRMSEPETIVSAILKSVRKNGSQ